MVLRCITSMHMAKVGEVSNVAQVAQVCKGEMAERQSEETILAEPLSYSEQQNWVKFHL